MRLKEFILTFTDPSRQPNIIKYTTALLKSLEPRKKNKKARLETEKSWVSSRNLDRESRIVQTLFTVQMRPKNITRQLGLKAFKTCPILNLDPIPSAAFYFQPSVNFKHKFQLVWNIWVNRTVHLVLGTLEWCVFEVFNAHAWIAGMKRTLIIKILWKTGNAKNPNYHNCEDCAWWFCHDRSPKLFRTYVFYNWYSLH